MVVDKLVKVVSYARRKRVIAQSATWSCVAMALGLPTLVPNPFGHTVFLLGLSAVVTGAALGGLTTSILAGSAVLIGAVLIDRRFGSSLSEISARGSIFLIMTVLIAMGVEAFRRFQNKANHAFVELQKSEALMRTILETGPDAMLIVDVNGGITQFSSAGETLFGWSAADVRGRPVSTLMAEPFRQEYDAYRSRYLETGRTNVVGVSREVAGLRKDGSQFPMMLHVGEVRSGGEIYFTGFIHDLTDVRDLRAELAHVWSMNSLGEMAAVLAHELNQPLSAISNYVRGARALTARDKAADAEVLEALDKAADQAIRAGEIIRRMRGLVTRNVVERRPDSLAELISEVDFMTSLVAREGGATVRYRLAPGPDEVLVDRIQIQQVVMNLVRNAVEAMQGKEKRVLTLATERRPDAWVIRVEDTGAGLSADEIKRLFRPMESEKSDGMGLGLSISRAIVEGHAGAIWVEDAPLGGAAFCFSLPVRVESEELERA